MFTLMPSTVALYVINCAVNSSILTVTSPSGGKVNEYVLIIIALISEMNANSLCIMGYNAVATSLFIPFILM